MSYGIGYESVFLLTQYHKGENCMAVNGATPLGLNKTQAKVLEGILDNPYEVFGLDGDVEKSAQRAYVFLLRDSSIGSLKIFDVRRAISALKLSLSNRGKGLSKEEKISTQTSRYKWAKEVCARHTVTKYSQLANLCIEVWGTRLPDRYKKEIKTHIDPTPLFSFQEQKEMDDLFCEVVPNPTLEEVLSEKETQEESRVEFTLGGVDFVLTKGSTLTIKSITSDTGAVLSDITVQS
jgi:hypothetical protein